MRFRLRHLLAGSPPCPAESSSSPADRQFASDCSPPRFATTQLSSATGPWHTLTWTFTMLCLRRHERTRSRPCLRPKAFDCEHGLLLPDVNQPFCSSTQQHCRRRLRFCFDADGNRNYAGRRIDRRVWGVRKTSWRKTSSPAKQRLPPPSENSLSHCGKLMLKVCAQPSTRKCL